MHLVFLSMIKSCFTYIIVINRDCRIFPWFFSGKKILCGKNAPLVNQDKGYSRKFCRDALWNWSKDAKLHQPQMISAQFHCRQGQVIGHRHLLGAWCCLLFNGTVLAVILKYWSGTGLKFRRKLDGQTDHNFQWPIESWPRRYRVPGKGCPGWLQHAVHGDPCLPELIGKSIEIFNVAVLGLCMQWGSMVSPTAA